MRKLVRSISRTRRDVAGYIEATDAEFIQSTDGHINNGR